MKSFNEFESTEEKIDIQEQRLILINQSLQERARVLNFLLDKKKRDAVLQSGRDLLSSIFRGSTSSAARRARGQGVMDRSRMGPIPQQANRMQRIGQNIRTFGAYELGSQALGLGSRAVFGRNSQTVDALQKMIGDYANQELKAQGSSLRMRGTGIEGLRGKRSY